MTPDAVVTTREYLHAVRRALDSLTHEIDARGTVYREAVENLATGHAAEAARAFSSLLARRPCDPALHRRLGISHLRAGHVRLAAHHLETALLLLRQAEKPGIPLVSTLQIEFEACLVRLALAAAYGRLGQRPGVVGHLSSVLPLAWSRRTRRGA